MLVIDVQGNLLPRMHEHQRLLSNIERLLKILPLLDVPLVWSEQAPEKIGHTVEPLAGLLSAHTKPIAKRTFSCYACPPLRKHIDALRRPQVLVCGIEAHVCVYQTARDLHKHGYHVHIIADAVSSRAPANTHIALDLLRSQGVSLTSLELAVCDLLQGSDHPKFREIMGYIK